MIDITAIMVLGVITGVFTGLVPGIHPNTIIFSSMPLYMSSDVGLNIYLVFITGLSVSHTFHDFLPAIYLGAPEAESALSALPGAEMASRGRGKEAFVYTLYGGAYAVVMIATMMPVLLLGLSRLYSAVMPFMEYILLFFLFFAVLSSDREQGSLVVAALSGLLGVMAFRMPVNQKFVLMPVFSGLFAVPAVAGSLGGSGLPEQDEPEVDAGGSARGGFLGALSGLFAGLMPGIGAAIATTFLSPLMGSRKDFLAGMGAINTSDILTSFLTIYVLGKARSGAAITLQSLTEVTGSRAVLLGGASMLSAALTIPIALKAGDAVPGVIRSTGTDKVLAGVLLMIVLLSYYLTGPVGLLVLLTSSSIGSAAREVGNRQACMAVLLIPSVIQFSGLGTVI
ncbi:MAG: tripartite tricarboxylate transporter permease [Candidatus Nanohaloarchaea archaeon]